MYFREFHQDHSNGSAASDDKRELKLALEVADIADELKMIKSLLEKQFNVIEPLKKSMIDYYIQGEGQEEEYTIRLYDHLKSVLHKVNETKSEAEETYKSVRIRAQDSESLQSD